MQMTRTSLYFSLLGLAFAGCSSGSNSSDSFVLHNTTVAVAGTTPIAISAHNLAFLASEATTGATGTDFNGDGDFIDSIAVAVAMGSHVEHRLDVAALDMAWIGNELYLAVDEALDANDWNNDLAQDDVVLLHWSASANALAYVDDLASASLPQFVAVGTNLFYTAAVTTAGANLSNLRVISSNVPLSSTGITTQDGTAELTVELLALDDGMLFLGLNEVDNGRDLNTDGDATDTHVLALLDATFTTGVIRNTNLALGSANGPFRAKKLSSHDWSIGFLVSEAAQDATNLNNPALFAAAWQATQCAGFEDADASDNVLHFIMFAGWNANPVTAPPRNTGLAGRLTLGKIAIAGGFIATICAESDEGTCDLLTDLDTTDNVVRWTQIVASPQAILPLNDSDDLHALFDCPGGTHGLSELSERFVIEVNEAADSLDLDGDSFTSKNLLGWLAPSTTPHAWDFTPTTAAPYAGATWMREKRDRTRLNVAFKESVNGVNINVHNPAVAGEDLDTADSVPTFAFFSGSTLSYPGVAIAVQPANTGSVIGRDIVFYRVDEAADSRDWNGDGDETDMILFRTSLSAGTSVAMAVLNTLPRLAVDLDEVGNPTGAALLADEAIAGVDFNGDGTMTGYVVRYFVY